MTEHHVVYCSATRNIIAYVRQDETDAAAIARLKPEYGTALSAMPAREAQDLYETSFKTPVQEITSKEFDYALNVLPPVAWTHARGAESFKISERVAGCVTAIYVEMGRRYFRFHDDIRTPHDRCCDRVAAYIAAQPDASVPAPEVKP
ncbi:hypothetical protein [Hyphomicrobium sp.]|uniref:hypothetical protein n=1 Tax=Hyphomicrobium sp. TaxID=82 RepID=UPI002E36E561|nr:hypothetical protein [Hyphomicrobium sp.]HEX2842137.1 hypothetical protein [Hyphomicrobium sp.]